MTISEKATDELGLRPLCPYLQDDIEIAEPLFRWRPQYEVGVEIIDFQHQKLVRYINEFYEATKSGECPEILAVLFERLIAYTETHFALEEKLMEKWGYPKLHEHRLLHQELILQVKGFKDLYKSGEDRLPEDVLHFLKKWLKEHILLDDKSYMKFVPPTNGSSKPSTKKN